MLEARHGGSPQRSNKTTSVFMNPWLDGRLMSVPFRVASNTEAPEIDTPVALFAPPLGGAVQQGDARHQYMVSSDGQRFLVATVAEAASSPITVILNWKPRP
jgi:hypothetical protein